MMKLNIFSVFMGILASFNSIGQENIKFLPFAGKSDNEVILIYNTQTGKSMEWYFDDGLKKMNRAGSGWQLPENLGVDGNKYMEAYVDVGKSEVILVWNPSNGKSVSWYYDELNKKILKSKPEYQLPENIGINGNVMMKPYIGKDNSEVILCWDTKTGKSVSYYYDRGLKKFGKADEKFQLPAVLGVSGDVMLHPYIGTDGSEIVFVWDKISGKSLSYFFDNVQSKFIRSQPNFELPSTPVITGNVMMYPYIGSDGSEVVLTWNVKTGKSFSYFYDNATKKIIPSQENYQLPANLGVAGNYMICPIVTKGDEVIYVWNAGTGKSINYYFDKALNKYNKSEDKFQIPEKALE